MRYRKKLVSENGKLKYNENPLVVVEKHLYKKNHFASRWTLIIEIFHSAISFDNKKMIKLASLLIKLWSLKKNSLHNKTLDFSDLYGQFIIENEFCGT